MVEGEPRIRDELTEQTFHTFSFASWQDYDYDSFGSLRVINEDRVAVSRPFHIKRKC
jgi:hypothetical protein